MNMIVINVLTVAKDSSAATSSEGEGEEGPEGEELDWGCIYI
jgi:hypothetical protein